MRIITSIACGALVILFGALGSVWNGFLYFSLSMICVLALVWVVFFVQDYIEDFVTDYQKKFNLYFAQTINSENTSTEVAKKNILIYEKKFKKTLVREKLIRWVKICVLYAIVGICILCMMRFI